MLEMLAINPASENPSRLGLKAKDTEFTATLAGFGLSLTLLSWNPLFIVSPSVTDQKDLLEPSVVALRSSDNKGIAVCKSMSLC